MNISAHLMTTAKSKLVLECSFMQIILCKLCTFVCMVGNNCQ